MLKDKVVIQGHTITYLDPDEPFDLLGLKLTMTLDWHPQYEAALRKIKEKAHRISSSWPRARQKERLIQSVVRPIAIYPF